MQSAFQPIIIIYVNGFYLPARATTVKKNPPAQSARFSQIKELPKEMSFRAEIKGEFQDSKASLMLLLPLPKGHF